MIWPFFRNTVQAEVKHREISLLLHSTHLYKNLPQILESQTLSTARALSEQYGWDKARQYLHDPVRYEKFAVGLDYLNGSLTVPNYELLYHRSKGEWSSEWVHLVLDLSLLYKEGTKFCAVSAAQEQGKHIRDGWAGFCELFADPVENYSRTGLPKAVPTHPQAEVLLAGSLPLSSVTAICVSDLSTAAEIQRMAERHHIYIKVEVTPHLFVWPERLLKK
jgi:hypothetical protein